MRAGAGERRVKEAQQGVWDNCVILGEEQSKAAGRHALTECLGGWLQQRPKGSKLFPITSRRTRDARLRHLKYADE